MPLPNITILSFNLSELKFSSFSHRALFDPRYHLRRQRIVIYQLAMMICLAAECCATYSLDKYEATQGRIENNFAGTHLYQNDVVDCEIAIIVFCVLVACVFGAEFFFLAQYPSHTYPGWYRTAMEVAAVITTLGVFASAVAATVVVATRSAVLSGATAEVRQAAVELYNRPPLEYKTWAVNIAFIVLIWIGLVFVVWSTYLMFKAAAWDTIHGAGPMEASSEEKLVENGVGSSTKEKKITVEPLAAEVA